MPSTNNLCLARQQYNIVDPTSESTYEHKERYKRNNFW